VEVPTWPFELWDICRGIGKVFLRSGSSVNDCQVTYFEWKPDLTLKNKGSCLVCSHVEIKYPFEVQKLMIFFKAVINQGKYQK
jgi:hypothetical protein